MKWSILHPEKQRVDSIRKRFRTSEIIATVLANRKIQHLDSANLFFNPSLDMLHDPFLMQDMDKAVERVLKNIKSGKPIMVFGDYDVDGTTSAAFLTLFFRSINVDVHYYIPSREKEGYGVSNQGIDYAKYIGADILITCDCGINAFEKVEYANEKGLDVIITDHHKPEKTLPNAFAIVNPKDRKSTRLNSSHALISYAVFCLKKKK